MTGDDGTSLMELMVGMVLMTIFMGMFTGAVVMMNSAMNKSQAINLAASQLNVAFANLDNTVRYAAAIGTPGQGASGDWYVELRTTTTGSEVCTQLRVDSQKLWRRTWNVDGTAVTGLTGWSPIASGISNGSVDPDPNNQPFYNPVPTGVFQQLTVNLTLPSGSGASSTTSQSSFTFTALNSVLPVPPGICDQLGRT